MKQADSYSKFLTKQRPETLIMSCLEICKAPLYRHTSENTEGGRVSAVFEPKVSVRLKQYSVKKVKQVLAPSLGAELY